MYWKDIGRLLAYILLGFVMLYLRPFAMAGEDQSGRAEGTPDPGAALNGPS